MQMLRATLRRRPQWWERCWRWITFRCTAACIACGPSCGVLLSGHPAATLEAPLVPHFFPSWRIPRQGSSKSCCSSICELSSMNLASPAYLAGRSGRGVQHYERPGVAAVQVRRWRWQCRWWAHTGRCGRWRPCWRPSSLPSWLRRRTQLRLQTPCCAAAGFRWHCSRSAVFHAAGCLEYKPAADDAVLHGIRCSCFDLQAISTVPSGQAASMVSFVGRHLAALLSSPPTMLPGLTEVGLLKLTDPDVNLLMSERLHLQSFGASHCLLGGSAEVTMCTWRGAGDFDLLGGAACGRHNGPRSGIGSQDNPDGWHRAQPRSDPATAAAACCRPATAAAGRAAAPPHCSPPVRSDPRLSPTLPNATCWKHAVP